MCCWAERKIKKEKNLLFFVRFTLSLQRLVLQKADNRVAKCCLPNGVSVQIKRETGENPVQSRCCELRKIVPISLLPLPVKGGKVIGRSESEDLQDKLTLICPRGKDAGRYLFFILFYANFSRAYACCSRACPMLAIFLFREGAE